MENEFMTLREAREYLKVSKPKIWRLVKQGKLQVFSDELDNRKKLVRREDVERLKQPKRIE